MVARWWDTMMGNTGMSTLGNKFHFWQFEVFQTRLCILEVWDTVLDNISFYILYSKSFHLFRDIDLPPNYDQTFSHWHNFLQEGICIHIVYSRPSRQQHVILCQIYILEADLVDKALDSICKKWKVFINCNLSKIIIFMVYRVFHISCLFKKSTYLSPLSS